MKKRIVVFIATFLLVSCGIYEKKMEGVFVESKRKIKEIHLTKDSYFIIRDKSYKRDYVCCDTLSYGIKTIEKGNNFLELNSSSKYNSKLNFTVEEIFNKDIHDSIKISVSTPLDSDSSFTKVLPSGQVITEKNTFLKYNLLINSTYSYSIDQSNPASIVINKKDIDNEDVNELYIIVSINKCKSIPISNIGVSEIVLFPYPYSIKNSNTNEFKISIPDLDYKYINFERLNKDYIKIKNNNTLIWNEKEYVRYDNGE